MYRIVRREDIPNGRHRVQQVVRLECLVADPVVAPLRLHRESGGPENGGERGADG